MGRNNKIMILKSSLSLIFEKESKENKMILIDLVFLMNMMMLKNVLLFLGIDNEN